MKNLSEKLLIRDGALLSDKKFPRPLVMTNGVFDILHRGHVEYLNAAARLGACLLVAVNSDSSVRGLSKGNDRPINSAEDRAYLLAGLESVGFVTVFHELTPLNLIREIRPEVYTKGGDYQIDTLEETKLISEWNGRAISIPFRNGYSTTSLIERIRLTHLR